MVAKDGRGLHQVADLLFRVGVTAKALLPFLEGHRVLFLEVVHDPADGFVEFRPQVQVLRLGESLKVAGLYPDDLIAVVQPDLHRPVSQLRSREGDDPFFSRS